MRRRSRSSVLEGGVLDDVGEEVEAGVGVVGGDGEAGVGGVHGGAEGDAGSDAFLVFGELGEVAGGGGFAHGGGGEGGETGLGEAGCSRRRRGR